MEKQTYVNKWKVVIIPSKQEYWENPERYRKAAREYRNKNIDVVREKDRKRYLDRKEHVGKYHKKYYLDNKDKICIKNNEWIKNNLEKVRKYKRKYFKTIKGKETSIRTATKRDRQLNWIKLFNNPFPDDTKINYHHINDMFVVPMPRNLHQAIGGNRAYQ